MAEKKYKKIKKYYKRSDVEAERHTDGSVHIAIYGKDEHAYTPAEWNSLSQFAKTCRAD